MKRREKSKGDIEHHPLVPVLPSHYQYQNLQRTVMEIKRLEELDSRIEKS